MLAVLSGAGVSQTETHSPFCWSRMLIQVASPLEALW